MSHVKDGGLSRVVTALDSPMGAAHTRVAVFVLILLGGTTSYIYMQDRETEVDYRAEMRADMRELSKIVREGQTDRALLRQSMENMGQRHERLAGLIEKNLAPKVDKLSGELADINGRVIGLERDIENIKRKKPGG